jgi:hypothetical protein
VLSTHFVISNKSEAQIHYVFIYDEESSTQMFRVLVLGSFLKEENQRASIGMIRQSIARENMTRR